MQEPVRRTPDAVGNLGGTMNAEPEGRCSCCDLPAYSCGRVIAARQSAERQAMVERALQRPGVVRARHTGRCASCSSLVHLGEPIRKTEDGWVSVLCCPTVLDD